MTLNATIRIQTGIEQTQYANPPFIGEVTTYDEKNIEIEIDDNQLAEAIEMMIRTRRLNIYQ